MQPGSYTNFGQCKFYVTMLLCTETTNMYNSSEKLCQVFDPEKSSVLIFNLKLVETMPITAPIK